MKLNPWSSMSPETQRFIPRNAMFSDKTMNSWIFEPQVNYYTQVRQLKVDILVGSTIQSKYSNAREFGAFGYSNDLNMEDFRSAPSIAASALQQVQYKYAALFSRLNFNVKDRYIFNVTARREGSSRFGKESQINNFGAIGGAWILSEEDLFDRIPIISYAKIRASYGFNWK